MLFCHITSRIEGRAHDDLLGEKGGRGFPTLMFLDASGESLGEHQGPRTVAGLEKSLGSVQKKAKEFATLRSKAEGGDRTAKTKLLVLELENGAVSLGDATKAVEELGSLSGALKKHVAAGLAAAEYREALDQVKGMPDAAVVAGGKFAAMAKADRIPEVARAPKYWPYFLEFAAAEGDLALFDKAQKRYLDALAASQGRGSPAFRQVSEKVEMLREDAKRNRGKNKKE